MQKKLLALIFSLALTCGYASMPQDTLLLASLVSTTANQLSELTALLKVTNKMSEQFTDVATAVDEKIEFAERLDYHVEELLALKEISVDDMDSLIREAKRLNGTILDTKSYMKDLERDMARTKIEEKKIKKQKQQNETKKSLAIKRASLPETASQKRIALASAKTDAYQLDELVTLNSNVLDVKGELVKQSSQHTKEEAKQLQEQSNLQKFYGLKDE